MIITWPSFCVASFRWSKREQAAVFKSQFGSQSLTTGSPLWSVEMSGVPEYWDDARKITLFIESLRGYANTIALWNLTQPQPAGTMRGAMILRSTALQGATTLLISTNSGQAAKTLLAGDLLGIGNSITQQVVRVTADATADSNGDIDVAIGTPLRNDFAANASVTWDKPKALFRQMSLADGIEHVPVIGQPWALSLLEDWRP